jgi:putative transposase
MALLPSDVGNLQARHLGPMASKRISTVLDVEISPALGWSTSYRSRCARTDSNHVSKQYWLGGSCYRAPRIHGELQMLAIGVSESTVAKYMIRHRKPPSQTWRTFPGNHVSELLSVDFFTGAPAAVPTATFRILYVFIILRHELREIAHFNATDHPTAEWTAQQIVEAFPFDTAPRYLIRDRDSIYDARFRNRVKSSGIEEVTTAPFSPWQNPYVHRIIGSIRRE